MMRNGVGQLIQTTQGRRDSIKPVVDAWRYEAMGLNGEAEQINRWFKGWYCARYRLGKEVRKKVGTVNELLEEGRGFSSFSTVSDPASLPSIEALPTGDFQEFASRESATKKIVKALKDEKINMVGVYGMGGLGKTTLLEEIRKNVKRDQLFDEVIVVTVSQKADLKKVKDDIAANLGVKLKEVVETVRARWLWMRLKDKNCVLVILDDLWERLNLAHLVIPLGDDHKGCKAVITTRNPDVCNQMETQMKIKLKVPSESDSWNLFWQKACDVVGSPLQTLAREVAKECGSLPLALVTLGRALRDKDQYVWEDVARQLKNSIFEGMSPFIASIKLSYDYLENEEMKRCFLVCCIFPEDRNCKEDLMWDVIGEELLRNVDTLEEARGRLHILREKVIASCLLLKGDKDGCIKMHDVVPDAALSIASEKSNGFIVKAGLGLIWWPSEENLRTCMRMSLMTNKINSLPNQPECPQLLTLSLFLNSSLEKFLDSFFWKYDVPCVSKFRTNGHFITTTITLMPHEPSNAPSRAHFNK